MRDDRESENRAVEEEISTALPGKSLGVTQIFLIRTVE